MKNKSFDKKRLAPTVQHHPQTRNENTLWEDDQEPEHNQEDLGGRGDRSFCWNAWEVGNSIELRVR
jgi:hypothetical protein